MRELIERRMMESIEVKTKLLENDELISMLEDVSDKIVRSLKQGGKLVLCGNGGSASDALHFAGEIVGRFQKERDPWPAVVLHADVASLTAIANDYSYVDTFAREAKAFTGKEDVFVGISTSGNSENVFRAIDVAKKVGAVTVAFLGKDGGIIKGITDYPLVVPCSVTARIQECHIMLIHILCEMIEEKMEKNE